MGRAFEFRKARKLKRWGQMAKTFNRIGKDIVMAVKEGGSDPDANSRLRAVMQNAKAANMPKDNVERAIKKASENNIMLLSSHLIDVLENILDEVIFIKEGAVVLQGDAERIREDNNKSIVDMYKEVFAS